MSKSEWIEKNRDGLERLYHEMFGLYIEDGLKEWDALQSYEQALVQMGILEPDEDEDDEGADTNGTEWEDFWYDSSCDGWEDER